ncbi:MAG TPA: STAS domain-containing protein [Mycobacteriales bacterium]|nr:STAS domain-containing protein [Mycobacteriales bacterium]
MLVREGQLDRVVVLTGPVDAASVPDLRLKLHAAIDAAAAADEDLIVDLAGVFVIDATGLGLLVGAHRRASRTGCRLVLRSVPPQMSRLLRVTRLNRILHIEGPVPAV